MDLGIDGKRAAVAASSSGLGLATAAALAREGARVAICGRDGARLERALEDLRRDGADVVGTVADVATPEGGHAFVTAATEALGGLDILVANGGGPPVGGFDAMGIDDYRAALDQNLLSMVAMCQAAVPGLRDQGWGRIVAITSQFVRQPAEGMILSNTARAGLTGFLKTLSREVAPRGVTVNSVQPGSHDTERLRNLHGGDLSTLTEQIPVRAVGRADDFGAVVAFLCSAHARFITGAAIPVDGGTSRGLL